MKNNIILVIAAHPDDEVLGCGGTIAKHVKNGDEVHVLILAEGITSRNLHRNLIESENDLCKLKKEATIANEILGVRSLNLCNFPDNRLDSIDRLDIIKKIEYFVFKFKPNKIYTHHIGDVNIDHQIINGAVVTACRPISSFFVKTILFFEIASSTEWQVPASNFNFSPNWFVDISDFLKIKLQSLGAYKCEIKEYPHSRSLKALRFLARWRGTFIGVNAAEAFVLGRKIN